jgi:hypothetical protein
MRLLCLFWIGEWLRIIKLLEYAPVKFMDKILIRLEEYEKMDDVDL